MDSEFKTMCGHLENLVFIQAEVDHGFIKNTVVVQELIVLQGIYALPDLIYSDDETETASETASETPNAPSIDQFRG